MAWTRARFVDEYVPGLFMVAVDAKDKKKAESMWRDLVSVKSSKKKKEENVIRSGLGFPVVKGEGAPITFDTQIAGPKQTWIHRTYALAVTITEEAIEDNLYELRGGGDAGELKELFADLGNAAEEGIEVEMAKFLVSGAATTYHTTRFAKALFATDHPRLDGSSYSNKATSADLTYTSFWANLVSAENQYDHRQHRIMKKVKNLWVPPALEYKALEILKSSDRPDTGNRATNALAASGRKIGLKTWAYLTDTDAWYMQLDGRGIVYFDRRKTRFAREKDFITGDMRVKMDQRWSAEIDDEQSWYGNVPA
jgi:hypothetical protein